ncbi:MAG: C25 family cysteine peptidase [Planctomycetota bacterium]
MHRAAMRQKYGAKVCAVDAALRRLIAADARRGLATTVVAIDDARTMRRFDAPPVGAPAPVGTIAAERATKRAVDAVYAKLRPHYLMLLDGPDVIPHQSLRNDPGLGGTDPIIASDLPYACDVGWSRDRLRFTGPVRVVGRVPGVTGSRDPTALVAALAAASRWRPTVLPLDRPCLTVAASNNGGATDRSLDRLFGAESDLRLVPPSRCHWPQELLRRPLHYFDCHGVDGWSDFEGKDGSADSPIAHSSRFVRENLPPGIFATMLCCYGAQLYDHVATKSFEPMANSYFRRGALAYMGSTTMSYGGVDDAMLCDKLASSFVFHLLRGASTGRALLEARHDFLRVYTDVEATVATTLAQFLLLGDPSVHATHRHADARRVASGPRAQTFAELALRRGERRLQLDAAGSGLQRAVTPYVRRSHEAPATVLRRLRREVRAAGGDAPALHWYEPRLRASAVRRRAAFGVPAARICIASSAVPGDGKAGARHVLAIARTEGDRVVSVHRLASKGPAPARTSRAKPGAEVEPQTR